MSGILLLLAAILWGFSFVAQVVAADHIGMFSFNAIRFPLGVLTLIPVVLIFERKQLDRAVFKKTFFSGLLAGSVLFCASSFQQLGVAETGSAGEAGFLSGLYPALVPIFGILLGRKPTWFSALGALLTLGGLYCISVNESFSISFGHCMFLVSACFWAWHILVVDIFGSKCPPITFSCIQFSVCALLSIICTLLFETVVWQDVFAAAPAILYGGVITVGIAYTLQVVGQRNVDPTVASILLSSEAMFSVLGGALILGEVMTTRGYIGCGLIFCGILVSQIFGRKKAKI